VSDRFPAKGNGPCCPLERRPRFMSLSLAHSFWQATGSRVRQVPGQQTHLTVGSHVPGETPEEGNTPVTLTPGQVPALYFVSIINSRPCAPPTGQVKSVASTHRIALGGAFLTDVFWRIAPAPCEQDTSPDVWGQPLASGQDDRRPKTRKSVVSKAQVMMCLETGAPPNCCSHPLPGEGGRTWLGWKHTLMTEAAPCSACLAPLHHPITGTREDATTDEEASCDTS
jgi:hypothetical protein